MNQVCSATLAIIVFSLSQKFVVAAEQESKQKDKADGNIVEGLCLKIKSNKTEYEEFHPIELQISLKNITAKRIGYQSLEPLYFYKIRIVSLDGEVVPTTLYYKVKWGGGWPGGSMAPGCIEPGKSTGFTILNLNRLFDLSVAGEYKITVTTDVPKLAGEGMAKITSNTVSISITPNNNGIFRWDIEEPIEEKQKKNTKEAVPSDKKPE